MFECKMGGKALYFSSFLIFFSLKGGGSITLSYPPQLNTSKTPHLCLAVKQSYGNRTVIINTEYVYYC